LILFIDDDTAGRGSVSTFEKFMGCDFRVAVVPGMDPGAANESQLRQALASAVSWVDFLMAEARLFDRPAKKSFSLTD
jgi:hypothetical protein